MAAAEADCFISLMLAMYGGQIAVFAVQDMLLFSWCGIRADPSLPATIWGKKSANTATKFILYTAGVTIYLVAALTMAFYGDTVTFDMRSLAVRTALNFQLWSMLAF